MASMTNDHTTDVELSARDFVLAHTTYALQDWVISMVENSDTDSWESVATDIAEGKQESLNG